LIERPVGFHLHPLLALISLNLNIWDAPSVMHKMRGFLRTVKITNQQVAELVERHRQSFVDFSSIKPSKDEAYVEEPQNSAPEAKTYGIQDSIQVQARAVHCLRVIT